MTGLDIWASLLSTGIICTFYTTVVNVPLPHPTWAACPLSGRAPGQAHSLPSLPFLQRKTVSQLGLLPHLYYER